jgi:hypothetical protein
MVHCKAAGSLPAAEFKTTFRESELTCVEVPDNKLRVTPRADVGHKANRNRRNAQM